MARRERLTVDEVQGAWAILPTPAKPGADSWRAVDTVDLDETARVVNALIDAGIDGLLSLGTYGECATLSLAEKRAFIGTAVDAVAGRVPFFAGTTALGTRESINETRLAMELGADGTMLGIPMWCKADTPTAVQFYRDVTDAVPEAAICIYANTEAFKYEFPRPFWAQVSELPQVIAAKYLGIGFLAPDLRLSKGRIRFLPTESNYYSAARVDPEQCTAFWTGGALCGPAPVIRLRDEVIAAKRSGDWAAAKALSERVQLAFAGLMPNGDFAEFSKYNVGLEKARMNAAGWVNAGPARPPYHVVPEAFLEGARSSGKLWAKLHAEIEAQTPALAK